MSRRTVLLIFLLAALPVTAVGQQPPTVAQLQQREQELQKREEELNRQLLAAQKRARDLENDESKQVEYLKELQTQLTSIQGLLRKYAQDIDRLDGRVDTLQEEIRRLDGEITVLRGAVAEYAVRLYKHGRTRMYEVVLGAESFTEGVRRLKGVMTVAARQRQDVERLADTRREKDDARAEVASALAQVRERRQTSQRRQGELTQTKAKSERLVEQIRQDQQKVMDAMKQAQDELEKVIAEKMAANRRLRELGLGGNVPLGGFRERQGSLVWPLNGTRGTGRVIRGFGRQVGVDNTVTRTPGIDIIAPDASTPVVAVHNAVVLLVGWYAMLGNVIVLDHGDDFATVYTNTERVSVQVDQGIQGGISMGLVGDALAPTGDEPAGNILRFAIYVGGRSQDPMIWLGGGR